MKQQSLFPDHAAERRAAHICHARDCGKNVPPEFLMCGRHWRMVPKKIRDAVWKHYREGQCDDLRVTREWLQAADAAIGWVARSEGKPITKNEAAALEVFV